MYGIGLTEILVYLTLATFFAIWKTVGPPRFGHHDLFVATSYLFEITTIPNSIEARMIALSNVCKLTCQ
jgi:hypothetical protein